MLPRGPFLAKSALVSAIGLAAFVAHSKLPWTASQAEAKAGKVRILESKSDLNHPSLGPDNAPVKIEFFVDLGDAGSGRIHRSLLELSSNHPKRLQVIYRLSERSERSSSMAQNLGRAAFERGRFWAFLDNYYGNRNRPPSPSQYQEVAESIGLDYEEVQSEAQRGRYDQVLESNYFRWRRMYLTQIPGLLVNGRPHVQTNTPERLEALYDEAYSEALTLLSSGIERDELIDYVHNLERKQRAEQIPRVPGPIDGDPSDNPTESPVGVNMATLVKGSHRQGPADAKITAAFVCHLQSSMCRLMYGYLQSLRRTYPDELEIVFHPYFDPKVPGEELAGVMYEGALCAERQGAFFEFYEYALEHNRRMNFDEGLALELAGSPALDLDLARFEACLNSDEVDKQMAQEVHVIRKLGIRHTPAFAVNGLLFYGRLQSHELRIIVDQELEPGLLENLLNL